MQEDVTRSRMIKPDNCLKFNGRIKAAFTDSTRCLKKTESSTIHSYDSLRVHVDFKNSRPDLHFKQVQSNNLFIYVIRLGI